MRNVEVNPGIMAHTVNPVLGSRGRKITMSLVEFQASLIQSENLGHKIIIIEEGREKGREGRQANHHYKPAELLTAPPSNIRITVSIKNTLIALER